MLQSALAFWSAPVLRRFGFFNIDLFRQFAKPAQSEGSLRVVHFMSAMERPDSNALKPRSLNRTYDVVLLLHSGDPVIAPGANTNWRAQKISARPYPRISFAEAIFVRAGQVDSDHATAVSREQRCDETGALPSARESSARDRPLFRPGKAAVKPIDRSEGHGAAPGGRVVSRMLRTVACEQHPPLGKSDPPIKIREVISILTLEIAGGTDHQNRPALSRIKIVGRRQHSNCVLRYDISSLRGQ